MLIWPLIKQHCRGCIFLHNFYCCLLLLVLAHFSWWMDLFFCVKVLSSGLLHRKKTSVHQLKSAKTSNSKNYVKEYSPDTVVSVFPELRTFIQKNRNNSVGAVFFYIIFTVACFSTFQLVNGSFFCVKVLSSGLLHRKKHPFTNWNVLKQATVKIM